MTQKCAYYQIMVGGRSAALPRGASEPLPYADLLDKAAQAAGTCDLYVGDDGMIYCG